MFARLDRYSSQPGHGANGRTWRTSVAASLASPACSAASPSASSPARRRCASPCGAPRPAPPGLVVGQPRRLARCTRSQIPRKAQPRRRDRPTPGWCTSTARARRSRPWPRTWPAGAGSGGDPPPQRAGGRLRAARARPQFRRRHPRYVSRHPRRRPAGGHGHRTGARGGPRAATRARSRRDPPRHRLPPAGQRDRTLR